MVLYTHTHKIYNENSLVSDANRRLLMARIRTRPVRILLAKVQLELLLTISSQLMLNLLYRIQLERVEELLEDFRIVDEELIEVDFA